MIFKNTSSKFESQVHLGLLAIIFVLILLNFVSNYVTYNAKIAERRLLVSNLQTAAVAIASSLPDLSPFPPDSITEKFQKNYRLSNLFIIPSQPEDASLEARKRWFVNFVRELPPGQVPDFARKILGAEFNTLTRGKGNEYFMVHPVPSPGGSYLMILSVNSSELAYLDDSGSKVLATTIVTTILIIFTYYLLVRYIFTPFRKLKQQAVESGRIAPSAAYEAEAAVEDYRTVIGELKEKELKLLELNREISRRAASLEQFNDYLLQSTNSGIITFDREGRILAVNRSASEILGIDALEYIGDNCVRLFNADTDIGKALQSVIVKRENISYRETSLAIGGGKQKAVGFIVSTVSDDHQQPVGASVILTDVNEIVGLRRELEAKNRLAALGEMSGGLAHQLRNSIGSMVGFCNLLKKQLSGREVESSYFDELFSEVKETEALVKKFLSFAGPLEYQPEDVNVTELVGEVVSAYSRVGAYANYQLKHTIKFTGGPDPIYCAGDPLLLKQALNNIIDNAISACAEEGGVIQLALEKQDEDLIISVSDNGCGIPEEDLNKIFTPFYSSKPSGTGLGLPLAGKIVTLHGGHIAVESKPGVGTTFIITLPLKVSRETKISVS